MIILLLACAADDALPPELETEVTVDDESGATLTVRWTTDEPGDAVLEYGPDSSYGRVVDGWSSEDGLEHAAVLAALPGGREWHWRALSRAEHQGYASADATFVPAPPPPALSDLEVAGDWEGLVLVPVLSGGGSYLALYDGDGRPVWWRKVSDAFAPITQARVSLDGRAVVYLAMPSQKGDLEGIVRLPIAGGPAEVQEAPFAHHDFLEINDQDYVAIAADVRPVGEYLVQGDQLLRVSAGVEPYPVWSAWDDLALPDVSTLPFVSGDTREWTHFNSLGWDGSRVWASSYAMQAVMRVNLEDGALVDQIGGLDSDYELRGGEGFGPQHGPLPSDDGFVIFNNRPTASGDLWSEAVGYRLDEDAGTYTRTWSYDAGRDVFSPVFGNVDPVGDGHLVGWGSAGRLSVLDGEHQPVWEADAPLGFAFGFAHPIARLSGKP